jgi:nucleoid DNA-binding protein
MNKTQFTRTLAEAKGISYKQAGEEADRFLGHLEAVLPTLEKDENGVAVLNLTGYIKFTVKDVEARTARNPQNGEEVQVDATTQVRASVGATLKSAVKGA